MESAVTREEGPSFEELPPSDWHMHLSVRCERAQPTVVGAGQEQASLGYVRRSRKKKMERKVVDQGRGRDHNH